MPYIMEIEGELCSRCRPIFSTLENLTKLRYHYDSEGYRHYKRRELSVSASRGCRLCTILWSKTGSLWEEDDDELIFRAHCVYFVHEQHGHPFHNAGKDLSINVSLLSANVGEETYMATFILITAAGK